MTACLTLYCDDRNGACGPLAATLRAWCDRELHGEYRLEVVDVAAASAGSLWADVLAVPALGRWLAMPAEELPGAPFALPRIQGNTFGASERFSVSPGREQEGLFHMPGGQSGHFLSPFYRAGHEDWAQGRPTPFLPRATRHRLTLTPAG